MAVVAGSSSYSTMRPLVEMILQHSSSGCLSGAGLGPCYLSTSNPAQDFRRRFDRIDCADCWPASEFFFEFVEIHPGLEPRLMAMLVNV